MPKVSVIIPFQNRIPWLHEAVDSVLAQTFQDFEIIIVDNESTDHYQPPDDPRIRYIRQKDGGPAGGRNRGMDDARGEYVAFLDSDDLFLPSKLERQVAVMEANPQALLSHTSYVRMSSIGEELETIHSGRFSGGVCDELVFACPPATPTVMMRNGKEFRFNESIKPDGDVIMWVEVAARAPLLGIDEPLAKVRMHGNNAAFNFDLQVKTSISFWRYFIKHNLLPRPLRSRVYLALYKLTGDVRDLIHAFFTWPANRKVWVSVARYFGEAVRHRLTHINRSPLKTGERN